MATVGAALKPSFRFYAVILSGRTGGSGNHWNYSSTVTPSCPSAISSRSHWRSFTRTGRSGPNPYAQGENAALLYAPLFWSYRPIRCSNGFRNHHQNYSPTTSPSRPSAVSSFPTFGGLSGDGEVPAQTIVRKGKRLPFCLIPLALVVPVSPMRARNKVSLAPWPCYMFRCDGGP